jgi:signal peptidase
MKRLIDTIKVIISVILIVTGAGVAFIALPIFGNQALIVRSGSMLPTIDVGSIIVIRPLDSLISPISATPKYEKGDIIAFRSEKNSNTIITHRVTSYEIFNGTVFYKTKGDANEEIDNWQVDEKNIIGKSFLTIPEAGKILAFAKSKYGFPLLIILPSLIVILMESLNIVKEIRKNRPQREAVIGISPSSYFFTFSSKALKVAVPIIALGFIIPTTLAFLKDTETSSGNVLQAAAVFPTSSVTITPTVSPSSCIATNSETIVINEINWSGSNGDGNDEWIELCNTTNSQVDLTNWVVENLGTGSGPGANITIPSGIIPPNGFFIISSNTQANSKINIAPDLINTGLSLNNGGEQLILKNDIGSTIDTANITGAWYAGSNSTPKKTMERKSPVGDGIILTNWQTATTHTNMDASSLTDEFATPKAINGL